MQLICFFQYAELVIKTVQIEEYIAGVFHRDHCKKTAAGQIQKDLAIFGMPSSDIILIDVTQFKQLMSSKEFFYRIHQFTIQSNPTIHCLSKLLKESLMTMSLRRFQAFWKAWSRKLMLDLCRRNILNLLANLKPETSSIRHRTSLWRSFLIWLLKCCKMSKAKFFVLQASGETRIFK